LDQTPVSVIVFLAASVVPVVWKNAVLVLSIQRVM
jgi:hypothetical protein